MSGGVKGRRGDVAAGEVMVMVVASARGYEVVDAESGANPKRDESACADWLRKRS